MVNYRDSAAGGGSLRVAETITNHLDPTRVSVEMVFGYGNPGPVARHASVPSHFISANGPGDIVAWFRARDLFKRLRPDVIHFQDPVVWLRLALLGTSSQKVVHVHGAYQKARRDGHINQTTFRASPLLRAYLKSTNAQICINNGARDSLLDLGWISRKKSYVVYNSIDLSRVSSQPSSAEARARLGLPRHALLLGMVCRLVWEKGCQDLLSIIERLPNRWHGVICGDGPERGVLEQACALRGLGNRIHFLGLQDDVRPVYAALDAYAFLSRYEPFGLVLAETMASRVPVFGIEGDGEYNEAEYPLITPETASLIPFHHSRNHEAPLPPEILDEVAHRVSNFGNQPERYADMIERARTIVEVCFDAPVQAKAITEVYEHICAGPTNAPPQLVNWYESKRAAAIALAAAGKSAEFETALA